MERARRVAIIPLIRLASFCESQDLAVIARLAGNSGFQLRVKWQLDDRAPLLRRTLGCLHNLHTT